MLIYKRKAGGYTLIELMLALAVNTVVLGALTGIFVANLNHYLVAIQVNRFSQQLQTAMDAMITDIRRAGYWSGEGFNYLTYGFGIGSAVNNSTTALDENLNPFQAADYDVTVGGTAALTCPSANTVTTYSCGNCIMFSYDHAGNKPLNVPSVSTTADDDRYGYRIDTTNNVLQTRPWGASFSDCSTASDWQNMTDTTVNVTALNFQLNSTFVPNGMTSSGLLLRSVDITLTAELANNPAITKTLTAHVRIRNDEFLPYTFP
jgi:Tfp pilus assembly protein PilW